MKRKIKVLFCDDAHTFGGAQKALIRLVNFFSKDNEFIVFCAISFKNKSLYQEFLKINNINLMSGYNVRKLSIITSHISNNNKKKALELLENINPDYTFLNLSGIEFGINYKKALNEKKIPHSSWIHNTAYFHDMLPNKKLQSKIRDTLSDILLINWHENLIVVSESSKYDMIKRGQKEKFLHLIENSLPDTDVLINKNTQITQSNKFKIGIFGRVQYIHKGQNELISLLEKYNDTLSDIEFHVIGDGEDLYDLKKNINKINSASVVFHGWIENTLSIMNKCDLVWMPSRFEGLSLVLLEALSLRKSVLSTNIPSFYLLHEEDKYSINDIDELYKKIIYKKDSTSISNNKYNKILDKLSSDKWFLKFKTIVLKSVYF